jgi:Fe-S oxidoreductase
MDAYTCTECGRCTSECPANQTGKLLSPRKIMMDTRDRIEELRCKDGERLNFMMIKRFWAISSPKKKFLPAHPAMLAWRLVLSLSIHYLSYYSYAGILQWKNLLRPLTGMQCFPILKQAFLPGNFLLLNDLTGLLN